MRRAWYLRIRRVDLHPAAPSTMTTRRAQHLHHLTSSCLALAGALALAACDSKVEGNGVFAERTVPVAAFDQVEVGDRIQATVLAGHDHLEAVISGDENVVEYVELTVVGGKLVSSLGIGVDSHVHPLRLRLSTPRLSGAVAFGQAQVAVTGAAASTFTASARSQGQVGLAGTGGEALVAQVSGGAFLYATGYPVTRAEVVATDGATVLLHSSGPVTGQVSGGGAGPSRVEIEGGGACTATVQPGSTCTPAGP